MEHAISVDGRNARAFQCCDQPDQGRDPPICGSRIRRCASRARRVGLSRGFPAPSLPKARSTSGSIIRPAAPKRRGDGKLALKLELPIGNHDGDQIAGEFTFSGNRLKFGGLAFPR